jgi:hypothetical protein
MEQIKYTTALPLEFALKGQEAKQLAKQAARSK